MRPTQLPTLKPGSWAALDFETSGLFPDDGASIATASVAWWAADEEYDAERRGVRLPEVDADGICAVAFPFDQGPQNKPGWNGQASLFEPDDPNLGPEEWVALARWIYDNRLRITIHNGLFDAILGNAGMRPDLWGPQVGRGGYDLEPLLAAWQWDTMLGQRVVWPTQPRSLKPAMDDLRPGRGERDAAEALKKHLGPKTDPRYDLVPWELIEEYAVKDARQGLWLQRAQQEAIEAGEGNRYWLENDLEIAKLLARMEHRGLPYDVVGSKRVAGILRKRMAELGGRIPFPHTDPGARKYFSVTSLTAEVLADLVAREGYGSMAHNWQRFKKMQTANKMWYSGYAEKIGKDGRLRTRFRQMGPRTGRMSCERVNLQAIPNDYRFDGFDDLEGLPTPKQLIKAAVKKLDGWTLAQLDAAQAELRVAVGVVNNRKMADQIIAGEDAHGSTAKALFRIDEDSSDWQFRRQLAKRCNFSLINGVGWETFRNTIHKETGEWLSEGEAQVIVRKWNQLYPQHKAEIYREMDRARKRKFVWLANGRQRHFAAYEDYYKAHGNSVQGSIGFLTLDWLLACEQVCERFGVHARALEDGIGGAGVVSSVHDSVYLLVPTDQAAEIGAACQRTGEEIWDEYFRPENNGGWSKIYVPGQFDLDL